MVGHNKDQQAATNRALPWEIVSPTAGTVGQQTGMVNFAQAVAAGKQLENFATARAGTSMLGILGTLLRRDVATLYVDDAGYTGRKRSDALAAGDAGESIGNLLLPQLLQLSSQTNLSPVAQRHLNTIEAATAKLNAMYIARDKGGPFDAKEFARLSDSLMRSVGLLQQAGFLKGILPDNPPVIQDAPSVDRTGGGGGGAVGAEYAPIEPSGVYTGAVLPPFDPRGGSGGGGAAPLPQIHFTLNVTPKDGVDAEQLAQAVRRELQVALGQAMNGGY